MSLDQRHNSDPFVCHENPAIPQCLRRGSASLVEMLKCRTHSLSKIMNPCLCPLQDLASSCSSESPLHAADYPNSSAAQIRSLLSSSLSPHQHTPHNSARHFNLPHLPLNLQRPSELRLNVPLSPQPHSHHCKACMSLLFKDRTRGGGSLGHTHKRTLSTITQTPPSLPTSPHQSRSSPATLLSPLASPSSPSPNSELVMPTSPSHLSAPSQVGFPRGLYEGGDLSLLNYCLHHIVSRRTSSPTLSDRGGVNHPMHSHGEIGGPSFSANGQIDKSQSLDVPFWCIPNLDRNLLLSPPHSEGRPDQLVG